MKTHLSSASAVFGVFAVAAAALLLSACSRPAVAPQAAVASPADVVARGHYLVHQVAMCIDCHSPRDETGKFVEAEHLTGSLLSFAATVPMPWAPVAPPIAGLPGHTDEQAVALLMTGERPAGLPPLMPPMPGYRMEKADAEAVVAYLRSLAPAAK